MVPAFHALPGQIVTSPAIADGIAYLAQWMAGRGAFDLSRAVDPVDRHQCCVVVAVDRRRSRGRRDGGPRSRGTGSEAWGAGVAAATRRVRRRQPGGRWRSPLRGDLVGVVARRCGAWLGQGDGFGHGYAHRRVGGGPARSGNAVDRGRWLDPRRSDGCRDRRRVRRSDGCASFWRFATPPFTDTPVIAARKMFLRRSRPGGDAWRSWAVDLESGREIWHHTRPSHQTIVAPAVDQADADCLCRDRRRRRDRPSSR